MQSATVGRLFCLCTFLLAGGASAASTVHGTVFGGAQPLGNVGVSAYLQGGDPAHPEATTVTDLATGTYSLSLIGGLYQLAVSPPAGSGYDAQTISVTANGDVAQDIVLVKKALVLSGTVRGLGGAPIPYASVSASGDTQDFGSASADVNGHYSIPVQSGHLYLRFNGGQGCTTSPCVPVAPSNWNFYTQAMISSSTSLDPQLPVVHLTGSVTDSNLVAVPNTSIQASSSGSKPGVISGANDSWNCSAYLSSDASGHYAALLLSGTAYFTLTPPAGSGFTPLSQSSVALATDPAVVNFVFPAALYLSGTVRGLGGAPIPYASVSASGDTQDFGSASADVNGHYSIPVQSGHLYLRFNGGQGCTTSPCVPVAPSNWNFYTQAMISSSTALDPQLPVVHLTGSVTDSNLVAVPNTSIQASSSGSKPGVISGANDSWNCSAYLSSDASGHYAALLLSGTAYFTLTPPAGSGFTPLSQSSVALATDPAVVNFVFPAALYLSGTVRGLGGAPIPYASVSASGDTQDFGSASADVNGHYSIPVQSGHLYLRFNGGQGCTTSPCVPVAPSNWNFYTQAMISSSTSLDPQLPVVHLTGSVTDSNLVAVPNTSIQASSSGSKPGVISGANDSWNCSAYLSSDASGHYAALLLSGTAYFTITPPAQSGFTGVQLSSVQLPSDLHQAIILQRPHVTPPAIVSGPTIIHLSDTSISVNWTTDESADSRVSYWLGSGAPVLVSQSAFTTKHSVTLTGLLKATTYGFHVSSTDSFGNGPTLSPDGTFTTSPLPDTTPPVVLSGPTAQPSSTRAVISWTTDEPAAGLVQWGTSSAFGQSAGEAAGLYPTSHSITLSGLSPSTTYFAQVLSTDPSGNQSTTGPITFTTTAAPATTPPQILSGPSLLAATDTTLTVTWTTDSLSTSGVSYNDGTTYDLVTDTALTTAHAITLTGLKPGTTYHLTVSSTDGLGNGPTVSPALTAATLAAPDHTPPVISAVQAGGIGVTSATITWTTDKPATSEVHFGPDAGAGAGVAADLTLATSHSVLLTGLQPGAVTWFVVRSVAVSGAAASAPAASFTTLNPPPPQITVAGVVDGEVGALPLTPAFSATGFGTLTITATLSGQPFASGTSVALEGDYALAITATDGLGQSSTVTVHFAIDRTAPQIGVAGVADGQYASGPVAPVVTVADAHPGTTAATLDGAPFASGTQVAAEGTHQLAISATDQAGNSATATLTFVLDFAAPQLLIGGIADGAVVQSAAPTFSASDLHLGTVQATLDGQPFASGAAVTGEGQHTLLVQAVDLAGNQASQQVTFAVDRTAPSIQVTGVGDGGTYGHAVSPAFSATDAHLAQVSALLDGAAFASGSPVAAEGAHVMVVTAGDSAGNTAVQAIHFTLDFTPPQLSLSGISEGALVRTATPVFSATDANGPSASALLDGQPFASGTTVSAEGAHTLVVTAADLAGNSTVRTVHFAVDATPPSITVSGVADGGSYTAAVTPLITVTDAHPGSWQATLDGAAFASGTPVGGAGPHALVVEATDAAGNGARLELHFSIQPVSYRLSVGASGPFPRVLALVQQDGCPPPDATADRWASLLALQLGGAAGVLAVDTADDAFLAHLRGGLYDTFVLVDLAADGKERGGDDDDRDDDDSRCRRGRANGSDDDFSRPGWSAELGERAWAGSAGVVAVHTSRRAPALLSLFGASAGAPGRERSASFGSAAPGPSPALTLAGPTLALRLDGGKAVAQFGSGAVAAVSNSPGAGRTLVLGFDLARAAPGDAAAGVLSRAVAWVVPAPGAVEPLSVRAVQLDATNTSATAARTRLVQSLDPALVPLTSAPPAPFAGGAFSWTFPLDGGATRTLRSLVRVPDQAGGYAAGASVSALDASGAPVGTTTQAFSLVVPKAGPDLLAAATAAVSALARSGRDGRVRSDLLRALDCVRGKRVTAREDLAEDIDALLDAADEAQDLGAGGAAVRAALDALLRYFEARWATQVFPPGAR